MRSSYDLAAATVFLAGLWMLWSGHYSLDSGLILSFGVGSVLITVGLAHRMRILDTEAHPYHLGLRPLAYIPWLFWQIVLANIDVAKRVLSPSLPIKPTMRRVSCSQKTDLGRVIYANSITLTPGTVSLHVDDDGILVHAIHSAGLDDLDEGEMDRRVSWLEGAE